MKTHIFEGKKFNKLIEEIEKQYNDQYQIIKQRQVKRNPVFFWLKKYEIEIALLKEAQPEETTTATKPTKKGGKEPIHSKQKKILDMLEQNAPVSPAQVLPTQQPLPIQPQNPPKEEEIGLFEGTKETVFLTYYQRLQEVEILPTIAERLVRAAQTNLPKEQWLDVEKVEAQLLKEMEQALTVTGELDVEQLHILALIGPTGVGKTTTIAKIAGYLIDHQKKVGLITTDVFRIGATDQLQIYANILDSEMIAVNNPEELAAAIEKLKYEYKVDVILIDTVGRSPLDVDSIDDVKDYLALANPDHVSLVLSSTQKTKDVQKILENFQSVALKSLIFTKLDETLNHGVLVNAVVEGNIPLSYITNGQNVPYDIFQAEATSLAKKILNGVDEFGSSIFSA